MSEESDPHTPAQPELAPQETEKTTKQKAYHSLAHISPLVWSDGTEWVMEHANENLKVAEQCVRKYYIQHGHCPHQYPDGLRFQGDDSEPNQTQDVPTQITEAGSIYLSPTTQDFRGGQLREARASSGYIRSRREAAYDRFLQSGDFSEIHTVWKAVSEHPAVAWFENLPREHKSCVWSERIPKYHGHKDDACHTFMTTWSPRWTDLEDVLQFMSDVPSTLKDWDLPIKYFWKLLLSKAVVIAISINDWWLTESQPTMACMWSRSPIREYASLYIFQRAWTIDEQFSWKHGTPFEQQNACGGFSGYTPSPDTLVLEVAVVEIETTELPIADQATIPFLVKWNGEGQYSKTGTGYKHSIRQLVEHQKLPLLKWQSFQNTRSTPSGDKKGALLFAPSSTFTVVDKWQRNRLGLKGRYSWQVTDVGVSGRECCTSEDLATLFKELYNEAEKEGNLRQWSEIDEELRDLEPTSLDPGLLEEE